MSNAYIEGLTKTRKPGRKYSAAGKQQHVNVDFYNYQFTGFPEDWPVQKGEAVQWLDRTTGEICEGTVKSARTVNGMQSVAVRMAGGKVKVVAVDNLMINRPAIVVDPEFKDLIPALAEKEYAALEDALLNEGCRDALVVWAGHNVLVDGHNRYELCTRHNLSYKVTEREFEDRDHVMLWMLRNQIGRRNYTDYLRDVAALKEQEIITRIAKKNQGARTDLFSNSEKKLEPENSWKEAAKNNQTSVTSMHRTKTIEERAPEPLKDKARRGEITRNAAYELTKALEKLPEEYRDHAAENTDSPERVGIWLRLYKSMGSPETNGTFEEIHRTGGFQYGKDMDKWCAFWTDPIEVIHKALQSVADHHKREEVIARAQERSERIATAAALTGTYPLIYADPPWQYEHQITPNRAIENHYDTQSLEWICNLEIDGRRVSEIAAPDAMLFMWTTAPKLEEAFQVVNAWGFTYRTCMVWDKELIGQGHYVRVQHELLLIAKRGNPPVPFENVRPSSVYRERRGEHSVKPHAFYDLLDRMYPDYQKLELFSRNEREGWTGWGNDYATANT